MKKIGLIGGMSWESTKVYYELINKEIQKRLGRNHSARIILESLDFEVIEKLQIRDDWSTLNTKMSEAATNLKNAEAEAILLCTNTMHLCAESIKEAVDIPFLHIVNATAVAICQANLKKILLLGTKFTMEKEFYIKVLQEGFKLDIIVPNKENRDVVHNIIYTELVKGIVTRESKQKYVEIITKHIEEDSIEGVILGCTEIPLLIKTEDIPIAIFDTTYIHAISAVDFMLN